MDPRIKLPDWTPHFAERHALFSPLQPLVQKFAAFEQWPQLEDMQRVLDAWPRPVVNLNGDAIRLVEQAAKPSCFEEMYVSRIFHSGELQTRRNNWHDYFQYLTWFMFPHSKALINSLHIPRAQARLQNQELGRRTPLENMLSLFDEGGALLVSSDESLFELVRDFKWRELFVEHRKSFGRQFECVVFGHAVYEKGLSPYVGMTANCILIHVDATYFQLSWPQKWQQLDRLLYERLQHDPAFRQPKALSPFPLLGVPGWDAANEDEAYYLNQNYFRPGRRGAEVSV